MKRTLSAAGILLVLGGCAVSTGPNHPANHRFSFEAGNRSEPVLEAHASARQKAQKNAAQGKVGKEGSNEVIRIKKNYSSVKIRPAPGNTERHIAVLRGGTKVEKMEGKGEWIRIRFGDKGLKKEGWVHKDSLQANNREIGHKRKKPKEAEAKIELSPL